MIFAESVLEYLRNSEGVFLWVQGAMIVLCIAHLIYCFLTCRRSTYLRQPRKFEIITSVVPTQWDGELDPKCPLSELAIRVSQIRGTRRFKQVQSELQRFYERVETGCDSALRMIQVLAQVAILLGLLGTVVGLVSSFRVISVYEVAPPPSELAVGVSQALTTTIFGLVTAIPAFLLHGLLQGSADRTLDRLVSDLERIEATILNDADDSYSPAEDTSSASDSKDESNIVADDEEPSETVESMTDGPQEQDEAKP